MKAKGPEALRDVRDTKKVLCTKKKVEGTAIEVL